MLKNEITSILQNPTEWREENGVFLLKDTFEEVETSFSSDMQDGLFDFEDTSWWFKYRGKCIKGVWDKFKKENSVIYDIGGGNGYTTKVLQDAGEKVVLIEPSLQACINGVKRELKSVLCATLNEQDFKDESIDSCFLLDVLEHIEEDGEFVRLIRQKLVREGLFLITVPAFMSLWSEEDVKARHFRRYKKIELIDLMKRNGFEIVYANYFFSFSYIPILLFRALKKKQKETPKDQTEEIESSKKDHAVPSKWVGAVLNLFEKMEYSLLMNNRKVPFGSSIILVAKKI